MDSEDQLSKVMPSSSSPPNTLPAARLAGREARMDLIWSLVIGGVAGFLAGNIMKGGGFGVLGNIIVGILGGILGGWLFGVLGIGTEGGLIGQLVTALVGAVVLLWIVGLIKGKQG
jgi:uncharacterized membrane protein YeaQ/YmgE (transglycosylase-associated protein family)